MRFHHVGVHVSDHGKSKPVYMALMSILGFENYDVPGHVATAWGATDCSFRIVQPPHGEMVASSSHICFEASTREAVEAYFATGLELGFARAFDPAEYIEFGHRHYTAMLVDYDGNRIEAVWVDPAPAERIAEQEDAG